MINPDSKIVGKKVEFVGSMGHWGIVTQNADDKGKFSVAVYGNSDRIIKAKSQDLTLL